MKRIIILILALIPILIFAQGNPKLEIDWISLEKAEAYAKKYNKNTLILFYRPGCEYCEKMKRETLTDPIIIKQINENFLPVMINGRGKDTIIYNGKVYGNQQPIEHGDTWRHDFFAEFVSDVKERYYWPTIVILNSKYEKLTQFEGFRPKAQLLRNMKSFINSKKGD